MEIRRWIRALKKHRSDRSTEDDPPSLTDLEHLGHEEKARIRGGHCIRTRLPWRYNCRGPCSFAKRMTPNSDLTFEDVFTDQDAATYTHICYLDVLPSLVWNRRAEDTTASLKRIRSPDLSQEDLAQWMHHERQLVETKCAAHNISFSVIRNAGEMPAALESSYEELIQTHKGSSHMALCRAVQEISLSAHRWRPYPLSSRHGSHLFSTAWWSQPWRQTVPTQGNLPTPQLV